MTPSITTLSITGLSAGMLSVIMLKLAIFVMLSDIMLNVIMLSVIMLSVEVLEVITGDGHISLQCKLQPEKVVLNRPGAQYYANFLLLIYSVCLR